MPVIAIPPCAKLHDYEESVRRAGGEPRVLRMDVDRPEAVIHEVDGLLLAGGGDVDPSLYGETPHAAFGAAEAGRDAYELELARRAHEADLPTLAICRGIQVLNVALGGTLVQDITDQVQGSLNHTVREPPFAIAHDVWIGSGTILERLLRDRLTGDTCAVNSRHHQAIKNAGTGLVVTATAPDGVIEGVEDPARRFYVGVQWHPENFYRTGEFSGLFEGLIAACGAP